MRTLVRCGVVACVVAMLAGCLGGRPASTATDHAEPIADDTAFDLLTQSGSYHDLQHRLTVAEERLVGRCMAAKGLAYPAKPPAADRLTDEDRTLDLEQRRRTGYGLSANSNRPLSTVDRYVKSLAPAKQDDYLRALFGDDNARKGIDLPGGGRVTFPGQGCVFEAQSRLFGDIVTWARITYVPEELNNKLADQVTRTEPYAEALRKWSGCMAQRGYDYSEPWEAKDDLAARYKADGASGQLREHEIDVAVADAECARQVGIPLLVLSLKRNHVNTLSTVEQRSLQHLGETWLQAAAAAALVIGYSKGAGSPAPIRTTSADPLE